MYALKFWIFIALCLGELNGRAGGTGVRNGPGAVALSEGFHLRAELFSSFVSKYDFGASLFGRSPKLKQCSRIKNSFYPEMPDSLVGKFVVASKTDEMINDSEICDSPNVLRAYQSLMNALYLLENDPLFAKVIESILDIRSSPITIHVVQYGTNLVKNGITIYEQSWVQETQSGRYDVFWGPPQLEGSNAVATRLLGRWEVPLLMHELGHVLTNRLSQKQGSAQASTVHDHSVVAVSNTRQTVQRNFDVDLFLRVRSDRRSAFYESFSNLLEVPYTLIHPMIWNGVTPSGLEKVLSLRETSLDHRLENEAFLSTVLYFLVMRPDVDSDFFKRQATHVSDLVIPYSVRSLLISRLIDAVKAIQGRADFFALMKAYDSKGMGEREGSKIISSYFSNISPKNADSYAHYLVDLERKSIDALPMLAISKENVDLAEAIFSKVGIVLRPLPKNVGKLNQKSIQRAIRSEKFKALTIVEIHELKDSLNDATYLNVRLQQLRLLREKFKKIQFITQWNEFYFRDLEPFFKLVMSEQALIEWWSR